ncbi:MAG: cellulase family glycosylhydrolase [Bacteroidota bacterium]
MKTGLPLLLFCICCTTSLFSQNGKTVYVDNGKIYSSCDEEIVMRGYNEMFIWSGDRMGITTLPEIAKTGSNAIRLVWTTEGDEKELKDLIKNSLKNQMIPVLELHDATGDFSKLQLLLDYWKRPNVLKMIKKYKKWLIVNIGNEVGSSEVTVDQWVAYYKDAITQLRNAGIDAPLMIDCGGYGSLEHYFLEGGQELLAHDPLKNIIFSVHTYWYGGTDADKIKRLNTMIADAKSKNLPYIIGEGPQLASSPSFCNEVFPYKEMIEILQKEKIGWLAWSWGAVNNNDCGAPDSVLDITKDGTFGNWTTTFAEEISISDPNSIQNTSVIPASLRSRKCSKKR